MGIFKDWLKRYSQPRQPALRDPGKLPHESTLTAVSGGMGSTELLIRLEVALGDIKSKTPIVNYAYELANLSHNLQARLLSDLAELADMSYPHGYEFLCVAADALTGMEQEQYDKWVDDISSLIQEGYDDAASELIKKYSSYVEAPYIVNLGVIAETLEKLVYSVCEKNIPVIATSTADNSAAYTDGAQIFLPVKISYFGNYDDNYRLYKILTFHLLEQIQSATWEAFDSLTKAVEQYGEEYLKRFSVIETLRINKTIKTTYPGVWRDIERLHQITAVNYPNELVLNSKLENVFDTLELVDELINRPMMLPELVYQPNYLPEVIQQGLLSGLSSIAKKERVGIDKASQKTQISSKEHDNSQASGLVGPADQPATEDTTHDTLPPDWQETPVSEHADSEKNTNNLNKKEFYCYKEWDTSLQKYRKDWCHVRETILEDVLEDDSLETSQALTYTEFRIKKILDLLTNEQRFMRYQNEGDDIDIDAWVSARSNKEKRADDYQNIYIRNNKNTRNIAIMFAVDISGSTRGWKNTAIKQSTWLLCKTLTRLDDQYAVYAFSGSGRKECHIYPVKTFSEAYSSAIQKRIYAMHPQQYTRMGAAIRHLSDLLVKASAKTRILFILTDGKPDDIDSYRGQYAIEDTRRAINEARALALNPFVLTFDKEGMDYLPHMLGSNRYQLISDVSQLPIQISTIYKHLTT